MRKIYIDVSHQQDLHRICSMNKQYVKVVQNKRKKKLLVEEK